MSTTEWTREEIELWWATNLQRIADENPESYGAALVTIDEHEVPCLCLREPDELGWYRVTAHGAWGSLFMCQDETKVKTVNRSDGVSDIWCHRSAMSPLRKWLEARASDGS